MPNQYKDPMRGPVAWLAKFLGSAFFGLLMSFVALFFIMVYNVFLMDEEFFLSGKWIHILWIIPLAWGALGVFCFDKMLELARDIFEQAVDHVDHWFR